MVMSAYPDVRVEFYSFLNFVAIKVFLILNLFSNICNTKNNSSNWEDVFGAVKIWVVVLVVMVVVVVE
jgi:hypothetical protein